MAFFGYDPYNPYAYYTAAAFDPYNYSNHAYCQRHRSRRSTSKTSFEIPVHGPDSLDPEPEPKPQPEREREQKKAMSAEEAVVRIQAAARGFLAWKSVRAVREVAREAEQVLAKIASSEAEALLAEDPMARVAVGEALMRMLLRLDAVRGAREYRRRVTKRVLALQDAVDALASLGEEAEVDGDASDASAADMDDEAVAAGEPEPEAEAGEEEENEAVPGEGDSNVDVDDEQEDSDAEGEWEMVTEETSTVPATSDDDQEPPGMETTRTASAGTASDDGVDAKVMEMVGALYKQSAVIDALVERVYALEGALRRMEDAESHRRRARKLKCFVMTDRH